MRDLIFHSFLTLFYFNSGHTLLVGCFQSSITSLSLTLLAFLPVKLVTILPSLDRTSEAYDINGNGLIDPVESMNTF